jgi:hypothetical protein
MYRRFFYSILVIGMMLLAAFAAEADEPQRRVVATRLVAEGIDPEQAQTLLRDPRVTVRPEIVLKNLFYSKPRPSRQRPEVMEVDPRQIARDRSFIATHAMMLDAARKRFGVSPRIITAILIVESWLGDYPMPYGVFNAYANLAFFWIRIILKTCRSAMRRSTRSSKMKPRWPGKNKSRLGGGRDGFSFAPRQSPGRRSPDVQGLVCRRDGAGPVYSVFLLDFRHRRR